MAKEAEPEMLMYVPKNPVMGELSRCAAVWSLGWLHAGDPDPSLGRQLIERVNDISILPVESSEVKRLCVISLGRMKSAEYAAEFRLGMEKATSKDKFAFAKRWALKQMTGEDFPEPTREIAANGIWFLEPISPKVKPENDNSAHP